FTNGGRNPQRAFRLSVSITYLSGRVKLVRATRCYSVDRPIMRAFHARDWGSNPHSSILTVCPNLPKNSSLLNAFSSLMITPVGPNRRDVSFHAIKDSYSNTSLDHAR